MAETPRCEECEKTGIEYDVRRCTHPFIPASPPAPEGLTPEQVLRHVQNTAEVRPEVCNCDICGNLTSELSRASKQVATLTRDLATRTQELEEARVRENDARAYAESMRNNADKMRQQLEHRTLTLGSAVKRAEVAESTLSALRALLEPIGELEQKATPAKWITDTRNHTRYIVGPEYNVCSSIDMQKADAELICALRNLFPALRERLEQT